MKNKRLPRNVIYLDGLPWYKRAGQAWGDYDTASEYIGIARSSMAVYVWRHNLRTITHGRQKLVRKRDLDRASGAAESTAVPDSERVPFRGRRH